MHNIYHLILIIVAAIAIIIGFRKGLVKQLASLLGIIAGVIAAQLFHEDIEPLVREQLPSIAEHFASDYAYSVLTSCIIFLAVYFGISLLSFILKRFIEALNLGIINSIGGSLFCTFKYMLVMSVIFNIIISIDPDSSLTDYCDADDGNIVDTVMSLAPMILSIEDPEKLLDIKQDEEAKAISPNKT